MIESNQLARVFVSSRKEEYCAFQIRHDLVTEYN